jgi:hypothetical protein
LHTDLSRYSNYITKSIKDNTENVELITSSEKDPPFEPTTATDDESAKFAIENDCIPEEFNKSDNDAENKELIEKENSEEKINMEKLYFTSDGYAYYVGMAIFF